MSLNNIHSVIYLSAIFAFSSFKKSDSGPGAPRDSVMTIASISPTFGPSNTLVTIRGTNFSAKDSVFINGKNAGIVTVSADATQLIVKVPPQTGTGNVSITANGKLATGPIFTFTGNTYLVSTFAGSGDTSSIDGAGTTAGFNSPVSLAIDRYDNLFVVDYGNSKIRKITPAGVVTTFAGSGAFSAIDGTGAEASFDEPLGAAVDTNGNVYVADYSNNKIRRISPAGAVSTFAGSGSLGAKDATGTAASFSSPTAVAVDGSGNVFVAEYGKEKIRKITPGGVVTTYSGSGTPRSVDRNGFAADFIGFSGISIDAAGSLYAADENNSYIRKITSDGTVATIAGKAGYFGYADGAGISAIFNAPNSVAVDGNGFLYVADQLNHVIRQITPTGLVTLLAGTVGASGTDNGPALKSGFNKPSGVAIDSHGNIFVADRGNNTIRKLTAQ